MGVSSAKKKLSSANRRLRERSKLSFLFVIFFFGLFSLIIVMESLMADGGKNIFKEDDLGGDGDNEDYTNWDISYEEVPQGSTSISFSSNPNKIPLKTTKPTHAKDNAAHHPSSLLASLDASKTSQTNNNHQAYRTNSKNNAKANQSNNSPGAAETTKSSKVTPIQPDWQNVLGSKEKFFVYSAYYNHLFE
jgi:hypothetical protein